MSNLTPPQMEKGGRLFISENFVRSHFVNIKCFAPGRNFLFDECMIHGQ